MTICRTNQICYCQFSQAAVACGFLLNTRRGSSETTLLTEKVTFFALPSSFHPVPEVAAIGS